MTRTSPPQVAFSAGEIDPLLHRRFDYQRFQTGLAKCHGFLPLPQGGFTRAPGTTYIGQTRGNVPGILVPFQFAANDAVVLEFTPGWMRVWRYGELVKTSALGPPFELAVPYGADDLPNLRWVQSADVIYLVDGAHPMQRLSRFALNNWTIAPQEFSTGPFRVQNLDVAKTVSASDTSGIITLTANFDLFQAGHVGSLMQLSPSDNTTIPLWTSEENLLVRRSPFTGFFGGVGTWLPEDPPPVTTPDDRVIRRYGRNVYELTQGNNAGTNPPIHEEGEALVDNAPTKWLYLNDDVGIVRITAITDARTATAEVLRALSIAVIVSPTYRWSEGAWSEIYGYPSSIELFDQRLCAAATRSEPRTVWFSTVAAYTDFLPSTEPDGAFAYAVAGDSSQNGITGLRRGRSGLHIFALSEEYSSRSETRAQVIGPTTAVFSMDGSTGAKAGQAIAPDGDPMFISRDGRRLMLVRYSLQDDGNREVNLIRASQHIGLSGFQKIIWTQTPEPRAWVLRKSGDLACMIYDQGEEILGWSTHSVNGTIVDIATSSNADGTDDLVYLIVQRVDYENPLVPIYTVEKLDYSHHLFAAKLVQIPAYEGPVLSAKLPWLRSQPVVVSQGTFWFLPNDHDMEYQAAAKSDGTVALTEAARSVVIGTFDASHAAQTLGIQAATKDGDSMGRLRRLHSPLAIGLHSTRAGSVQVVEDHAPGQSVPNRPSIPLLRSDVGRDVGPSFTGVITVDAPSGSALGVSLLFRPFFNAPMTVTGLVPTIQEAGR